MNSYKVYDTHEFGLDYNGYNFLVIYGSHINGGFIAIPNWNVSAEASNNLDWGDTFFNIEKMCAEFPKEVFSYETSKAIAEAIKEDFDKYLQKISKEAGVWQHFGDYGRYVEDGKVKVWYKRWLEPDTYYMSEDIGKIKVSPKDIARVAEEKYKEMNLIPLC